MVMSLQRGVDDGCLQTHLAYHHIEKTPEQCIWEGLWLLSWKMWEVVCKELQAMMDLQVMEESCGEWRSPMMLVPNPKSTAWFCIYFHIVNSRSTFVSYRMPKVDKLHFHLCAHWRLLANSVNTRVLWKDCPFYTFWALSILHDAAQPKWGSGDFSIIYGLVTLTSQPGWWPTWITYSYIAAAWRIIRGLSQPSPSP